MVCRRMNAKVKNFRVSPHGLVHGISDSLPSQSHLLKIVKFTRHLLVLPQGLPIFSSKTAWLQLRGCKVKQERTYSNCPQIIKFKVQANTSCTDIANNAGRPEIIFKHPQAMTQITGRAFGQRP